MVEVHEAGLLDNPLFYVGSGAVLLAVLVGIGFWVSNYGPPGMSAFVRGGRIHFRLTGRRRVQHDEMSD